MLTIWDDYEIQDEESKKKLEDVYKNPIPYIQKRHHPTFDGVLSRIRKLFKITPVAIKINDTEKAKKLREFILYLLITYTKEYEKIKLEFKLSQEELDLIKKDLTLEKKYNKEILEYFSYEIDGEIRNIKSNICFSDFLMSKINS